jgi:hypothetical protein
MKIEKPYAYLIGFITGVLSLTLFLKIIPATIVYKYNKAIELCEKDLPRSQECVITAIPKKYT